MPYEIEFSKPVQVDDPEEYFNECCYGGDVVSDQLLPIISERYTNVQANQEDWGWFIWFREGAVSLGVDIFCDDPATGAFRLHVPSRKKRWLLRRVVDTPELEGLKELVVARLSEWVGKAIEVRRLDGNFC